MEMNFTRWLYALLVATCIGVVAWQFTVHHRVREALRAGLLDRAEDISRAIAVVIRSEGRFDGVPQRRVEAVLNELTASTDLRSVSLRSAAGDVTAQAGPALPFELEGISDQRAYWLPDTAVFVNLVALGIRPGDRKWGPRRGRDERDDPHEYQPEDEGRPGGDPGHFENDGPRRGGPPEGFEGDGPRWDGPPEDFGDDGARQNSGPDRAFGGDKPRRYPSTGRRPMMPPEVFDRLRVHMDGEPLSSDDVKEMLALFSHRLPIGDIEPVVRDALVGKVLTEALLDDLQLVLRHAMPKRGRRGEPNLRWMDSDHGKLLNKRGIHAFVLEVPASAMYAAVRSDFRTRLLVVSMALAVCLVVTFLLRILKRSAALQVRLAQSEAMTTHLVELNTAAAGLVHETKNPLNLIRGQAQMIGRNAGVDTSGRETAVRIVEEADRVTGRLNQFLDYARPLAPTITRVDLALLVKEVFGLLEYDCEDKHITLRYRPDGVEAIQADGEMLRQVFFNLLLNAVESVTLEGQIEVASGVATDGMAWLEVRDNGAGVPEALRETLFQPYVTDTPHGTGLGLTIVRQIALAHGWTVSCENNISDGATFRVSKLEIY